MTGQHHRQPPHVHQWDHSRTKAALAAAHHHAARWARRGQRGQPDRDDLRQDILLAIVERSGRYDASQGSWSTFVSLLAQHVVADRGRADRSSDRVTLVSLDIVQADACATLFSATLPEPGDDAAGTALRIDLEALPADLPAPPRETLLLLIATQGDVAAARRASGQSCSAFYRSLAELRLWLRTAGLGVTTHTRGKIHRVDR